MQHVNLKIFAKTNSAINAGDAIPVFHRWIQQRALPELLIDVADYSHVPEGPGVLLIAHEANYSLDYGGNQLGLLYNRKTAFEDPAQEQLQQAYDAALIACQRLEQEPEFQGNLHFDHTRLELIFNDRLAHPNTNESWNEVRPEVERFFNRIFGAGQYSLERVGEPRDRLRASVRGAAQ